ncbi:hypothetical protein BH11PAT4_BH11PAT4_5990 [soil metagenome]
MERNPEFNELKKDLETLRKDVASMLKAGRAEAEDVVTDELEDAKRDFKQLVGKLREYGATGKEKATQAAEKTQAYAQENPWHIAAAAGAVGLLVGILAKKSRE